MRRVVLWALLAIFVVTASGCAYTSILEDIKRGYAENKEKTDEVVKAADEAVTKLGEIIDKADKDEIPVIEGGDPTADAIGAGAKAVAPMLPQPWGTMVAILGGLIPGVGAWLRASSNAKKRELEEALLIKALNELKHNEPDMFKKFIGYRDQIANGMMTAKEVLAMLSGIENIKTKYTS